MTAWNAAAARDTVNATFAAACMAAEVELHAVTGAAFEAFNTALNCAAEARDVDLARIARGRRPLNRTTERTPQ